MLYMALDDEFSKITIKRVLNKYEISFFCKDLYDECDIL